MRLTWQMVGSPDQGLGQPGQLGCQERVLLQNQTYLLPSMNQDGLLQRPSLIGGIKNRLWVSRLTVE